jgi:hypothetical protein
MGNLRLAFAEHQQRMRQLAASKARFAGQQLGSFVVAGAIEVAAAVVGHPLFGVGAATLGMTGLVPTLKDLKEKVAELKRAEREHHSSPVGLMFRRSK